MDGFYAAFMTGRTGSAIVLLAIKSNSVIGVDQGGLKYDGTIETEAGGELKFHVKYDIPPGVSLITGGGSTSSVTPVTLDFTVPQNFTDNTIVTIQTPFGPVNAKFHKLRDFDFVAS